MSSEIKLADQIRNVLRCKHYSIRTEKTYLSWIKQFVIFHGMRPPRAMGIPEIETFLSHLAVNRKVSASTQNQAFNAILFLYRDVLQIVLGDTINAVRAKRPARVPVVLSQEEVARVLECPQWHKSDHGKSLIRLWAQDYGVLPSSGKRYQF
jgi:hypothetical protein